MKNLLLIKKSSNSEEAIPKEWLKIIEKYKLSIFKYNSISIISSYINSNNENFTIFSESKLILYSKKRSCYIQLSNIEDFYKYSEKIIKDIKEGNLIAVTDSCFCIYDKKIDKLFLFSSCCGSGTIYFTESNNNIYFATHTNFFKSLRKFKISKLGLSEIIRYGANYSNTTIFCDLYKIPFASLAVLSFNRIQILDSYFQKIKNLYNDNYDFKSFFENIIKSYNIKKASILFSSGVDSTVIAESSTTIKSLKLFYMGHKKDENIDKQYLRFVEEKGYKINKLIQDRDIKKLFKTIKSYSLPSIDFSILPTEQLVEKSLLYSNHIIEGTGGDAWFGFPEIRNLKFWKILKNLNFISGISSLTLMRLFRKGIYIKFINYFLYVISRLSYSKRPELSQLASNPYSFAQMVTTQEEWEMVEKKISNQIDNISNSISSDFNKYRNTDACLVAISQFAAKTGQSSLRSNLQVFYPYFHPLSVSYCMQLNKSDLFTNKFGYKTILKKFLSEKGFPDFYIKRKKLGFQPPLREILLDKNNIDSFHKLLIKETPLLDKYFSLEFLNLIKDKKCIERCKTLKELYMIWSYLSIKLWITSFYLE